jgi:hypothetical protein
VWRTIYIKDMISYSERSPKLLAGVGDRRPAPLRLSLGSCSHLRSIHKDFAAHHMPRRPRPASREKPGEDVVVQVASNSKPKLPLPKATSRRNLKTVDFEPESDEENGSVNRNDSGSDDEDEDSGDGSLRDSGEESDVDVDAPRVAQWVDEEDLEQQDLPSGDVSHEKTVNLEDIVRFSFFCFSEPMVYRAPLQETVQDSKANDVCGELYLIPPSRLGFVTTRGSATCAAGSRQSSC